MSVASELPSVTVSSKVSVVSSVTSGAVKRGVAVFAPDRLTRAPPSAWVHE